MRKIIHIDMDAFFASVEIRENPSLQDKPVIIGGSPDSRSVVSTCNYIARKYGVHSALPSSQAKKLCPTGVFIYPRISLYKEVSTVVHSIFKEYTDIVEPLSLDEAYLDVSALTHSGGATAIALEIKEKIQKQTKLTASAGVSFNKFLAKVASDWEKPDGLTVIPPDKAHAFLMDLPIKKFWGIGKKTAEKMNKKGIFYGKDLLSIPLYQLLKDYGKSGEYYYNIVRGKDDRKVIPFSPRKSIGKEHTFHKDIEGLESVMDYYKNILPGLLQHIQKKQIYAKVLTLKVRYSNFETVSKVVTSYRFNDNQEEILLKIENTLNEFVNFNRPFRLIGLSFSKLQDRFLSSEEQLPLFQEL